MSYHRVSSVPAPHSRTKCVQTLGTKDISTNYSLIRNRLANILDTDEHVSYGGDEIGYSHYVLLTAKCPEDLFPSTMLCLWHYGLLSIDKVGEKQWKYTFNLLVSNCVTRYSYNTLLVDPVPRLNILSNYLRFLGHTDQVCEGRTLEVDALIEPDLMLTTLMSTLQVTWTLCHRKTRFTVGTSAGNHGRVLKEYYTPPEDWVECHDTSGTRYLHPLPDVFCFSKRVKDCNSLVLEGRRGWMSVLVVPDSCHKRSWVMSDALIVE